MSGFDHLVRILLQHASGADTGRFPGLDFRWFLQVHRVFPNGLASQEGTIQKGNEVLSINGKSLKGATHSDALAILRQARDPKQAVIVTRKPVLEAMPDLNSSSDSTTAASVASDVSADSSKCLQACGRRWGSHRLWPCGARVAGAPRSCVASLAHRRGHVSVFIWAWARVQGGQAAFPGSRGSPERRASLTTSLCFPRSRDHGAHGDAGEDLRGAGLQP